MWVAASEPKLTLRRGLTTGKLRLICPGFEKAKVSELSRDLATSELGEIATQVINKIVV
jgi:hypothetical protein